MCFFIAFCHTREALPNLCSLITGDALLYSMFRENASPVSCPLRGPFSFTYNRYSILFNNLCMYTSIYALFDTN